MNQVEEKTDRGTKQPDLIQALGWLPLTVTLEVPLLNFTVADLLSLQPETVVRGELPQGTELPLKVNGKLIARAKLEVAGDKLTARIMELA